MSLPVELSSVWSAEHTPWEALSGVGRREVVAVPGGECFWWRAPGIVSQGHHHAGSQPCKGRCTHLTDEETEAPSGTLAGKGWGLPSGSVF